MPFGTRGGMEIKYIFPADGDYLIEAKPKENGANDGFENFSAEIHQFDIAVDGSRFSSNGIGGPEWATGSRLDRSESRWKEPRSTDEGHRARESR